MPRLPEQNQTSNVILFIKSDIKPASNIVYLTNNKTILASFSTKGVQKISLPAGNYDFEFWSSGSAAYHLDAKLRGDTDTCINIGKLILMEKVKMKAHSYEARQHSIKQK